MPDATATHVSCTEHTFASCAIADEKPRPLTVAGGRRIAPRPCFLRRAWRWITGRSMSPFEQLDAEIDRTHALVDQLAIEVERRYPRKVLSDAAKGR